MSGRRNRCTVARRALGYAFAVECATALADELDHLLAALPEVASSPHLYRVTASSRRHRLTLDGEELRVSRSRDTLLAHLLWDVNQRAAACGGDRTLLHAGVVDRDGHGLLLPAAPESGKSTLVAGLVGRGYAYLSDEIAAVDPLTLDVVAYAKPLALGRGARAALAARLPAHATPRPPSTRDDVYVAPHDLGASFVGQTRPAAIVSPAYRPGSRTRIAPLAPAAVAMHLIEQTFHFDADRERNFRVAARLASHVSGYRLTVGDDLDEACEAIERVLGSIAEESRPRSEPAGVPVPGPG